MTYVIDKEEWLKDEVTRIRALTYTIDTISYAAEIPQNLEDIEVIARRARKKFLDLRLDEE